MFQINRFYQTSKQYTKQKHFFFFMVTGVFLFTLFFFTEPQAPESRSLTITFIAKPKNEKYLKQDLQQSFPTAIAFTKTRAQIFNPTQSMSKIFEFDVEKPGHLFSPRYFPKAKLFYISSMDHGDFLSRLPSSTSSFAIDTQKSSQSLYAQISSIPSHLYTEKNTIYFTLPENFQNYANQNLSIELWIDSKNSKLCGLYILAPNLPKKKELQDFLNKEIRKHAIHISSKKKHCVEAELLKAKTFMHISFLEE